MHDFVERLGYVVPGHLCHEHVDDLAHPFAASSNCELRDCAIEIGTVVKEEAVRLKLTLSDKSTLLPDNPTTREAVRALNDIGVTIKTAKQGDDVGVGMTANGSRNNATLDNRGSKAKRRAERNQKMCKTNKQALRIICPGVGLQQNYGHTAMGASAKQVEQMRSNLKCATHLGGTRSCIATTIALLLGSDKDPQASTKVDQINTWHDIWTNATMGKKKRIRT